jgi:hypothetical protein
MPVILGRFWLTSTALEVAWGQVELRQLEAICRLTVLRSIGLLAATHWRSLLSHFITLLLFEYLECFEMFRG